MDNGLKNADDLLRGIFSHMGNVGEKESPIGGAYRDCVFPGWPAWAYVLSGDQGNENILYYWISGYSLAGRIIRFGPFVSYSELPIFREEVPKPPVTNSTIPQEATRVTAGELPGAVENDIAGLERRVGKPRAEWDPKTDGDLVRAAVAPTGDLERCGTRPTRTR